MIDGNDFIACANRWAALRDGEGGGEAVWRTAIGRAYYGALHLGMELVCDSIGIEFRAGADRRNKHEFVQQALKHSDNPDAVKAGGLLADLHEYRKRADYELKSADYGRQQVAMTCVEIAHEIRHCLGKCNRRHHAEMRAAIHRWLDIQLGRA